MTKLDLEMLNEKFAKESPEEVIRYITKELGISNVILASSLSIEDQVLTDMLLKIDSKARVFFIDTGRHFPKTYELMAKTMRNYGFNYEVYAPENKDIEEMVSKFGPNLFYDSIEHRKRCCELRKVKPLQRALSTTAAWICGLRREQSPTRKELDFLEWDDQHGIYKINPIAHWSEEQVWEYIKRENVPYSDLYTNGFRSIGCEPCTRAVKPKEDVRSGRWWWESPANKECGLHPVKR